MDIKAEKPEFWETNFIEKQEMWGLTPAQSALITKDFFLEKNIKDILIPGIGYGRNAQVFLDNAIKVTGIEISKTAIELAKKHFGTKIPIYHGSATEMPFDNKKYDGIFCYGLIHLLDETDRKKLIKECFHQLKENGYMFFSTITKEAHTYAKGKFISKDRYEVFEGVEIFFYDNESIHSEFDNYGLIEISEVSEKDYPFYLIKCKKQ